MVFGGMGSPGPGDQQKTTKTSNQKNASKIEINHLTILCRLYKFVPRVMYFYVYFLQQKTPLEHLYPPKKLVLNQ